MHEAPFGVLTALPPIARPNLIGSGSNYRTHLAEMMTFASANLYRRLPGETPEQHFQRNLDLVDERGRTDTQFGTDLVVKYQPGFKPCGPFIVPKQFVDRRNMRIQLKHNGTMKQDWPVEDMVFSVEKLVTFGTERMKLLPGDIIFCGSPPGNGVMHGHFMVAGDVIEAEITSLGRQRNRCVDEQLEKLPFYGPWKA